MPARDKSLLILTAHVMSTTRVNDSSMVKDFPAFSMDSLRHLERNAGKIDPALRRYQTSRPGQPPRTLLGPETAPSWVLCCHILGAIRAACVHRGRSGALSRRWASCCPHHRVWCFPTRFRTLGTVWGTLETTRGGAWPRGPILGARLRQQAATHAAATWSSTFSLPARANCLIRSSTFAW